MVMFFGLWHRCNKIWWIVFSYTNILCVSVMQCKSHPVRRTPHQWKGPSRKRRELMTRVRIRRRKSCRKNVNFSYCICWNLLKIHVIYHSSIFVANKSVSHHVSCHYTSSRGEGWASPGDERADEAQSAEAGSPVQTDISDRPGSCSGLHHGRGGRWPDLWGFWSIQTHCQAACSCKGEHSIHREHLK